MNSIVFNKLVLMVIISILKYLSVRNVILFVQNVMVHLQKTAQNALESPLNLRINVWLHVQKEPISVLIIADVYLHVKYAAQIKQRQK